MEKIIEIPEGYKARIEDNKVILELKESEDERIRLKLIEFFAGYTTDEEWWGSITEKDILAWLEKQGEKTEDKLQVSDELYEHIRNTCAYIDDALSSETLVDKDDYLSMAERNAQSAFDMIEKQGEQKVPINDFKAKNWYVSEVDGKIHDMTYNPADKVEPKFHEGEWITIKE